MVLGLLLMAILTLGEQATKEPVLKSCKGSTSGSDTSEGSSGITGVTKLALGDDGI